MRNYVNKNKTFRILLCDTNYSPAVSAIRKLVILKIRGWQKRGAIISMVCSTEGREFYSANLNDVEYYSFKFSYRAKSRWGAPVEYIRANILAFPLHFKVKGKFDIVYSLSSTLDIIFFPWCLSLIDKKVKWFSMMDNLVPKPNERPGNIILRVIPYVAFLIGNRLLKRTTGIFVVTNMLVRYYEKKRIRVIKTGTGNGLDLEKMTGPIRKNTPRFDGLFGGRLTPAKGIFDLIEIIKLVVKVKKNFQLGVMGDGEEYMKKRFKEAIKNAGLSKNMLLLGDCDTKKRWDLYRSCGFFLFPSYAEGCPQVVLEAFAAGMLVLVYDLPEYRDAFKPYIQKKELILFKKQDYERIASYMVNILAKKIRFKNPRTNFSWDKIISKEYQTFVHALS